MHYKNGREAKVGDLVIGTTYNTQGAIIAGTLISLTPGPDFCSCEVGYLVVQPPNAVEPQPGTVRHAGSEKHGSGGVMIVVKFRADYSECKNLLHADDAQILLNAAEAIAGHANAGCPPNPSHAEYLEKWPGACYCPRCGNTLINAAVVCAPCRVEEAS